MLNRNGIEPIGSLIRVIIDQNPYKGIALLFTNYNFGLNRIITWFGIVVGTGSQPVLFRCYLGPNPYKCLVPILFSANFDLSPVFTWFRAVIGTDSQPVMFRFNSGSSQGFTRGVLGIPLKTLFPLMTSTGTNRVSTRFPLLLPP